MRMMNKQKKMFRIILMIIVITCSFHQMDWLSDVYSFDNEMKKQGIEHLTSYSSDHVVNQYKASKNNIAVIQNISDFDAQNCPDTAVVPLSDKLELKRNRGISECLAFEKTLFSE